MNKSGSLRTLSTSEEYWVNKNKIGKKVALYTHDDLDGLMCAIQMKKWLHDRGFEIVKYGIVNYMEGWKYTTLDPNLINIALDFANMPGDDRDQYIDYYLDHHGLFNEDDLNRYKNSPVKKLNTSSAYEALCIVLNIPQDELTLSVIDMVDGAKYQEYNIDWQRLLNFNLSDIKKSEKKRLEFAASFNQYLKRGDHKTLISVIANCKDVSIYGIFNAMKKIYPEHNIFPSNNRKKNFISDSEWRINTMKTKVREGDVNRITLNSQEELLNKFTKDGLVDIKGYTKIGNLVFIPNDTWANALRARAIVEKDFLDGKLDEEPNFILLQYGDTLQVCSYKKMDEINNLPTYKDGNKIDDLGKYMTNLLTNFKLHLGYDDPSTNIGQDEITVSGGHGGIGSISNINGLCKKDKYSDLKFIDMIKNKIINDLSSIKFNMDIKWFEKPGYTKIEPKMDNKVILSKDVTMLNKKGEIIKKD